VSVKARRGSRVFDVRDIGEGDGGRTSCDLERGHGRGIWTRKSEGEPFRDPEKLKSESRGVLKVKEGKTEEISQIQGISGQRKRDTLPKNR